MKDVTIVFPNSDKAMQNFVKWFRNEGFDQFTRSKFNNDRKQLDHWITCLATDEKTDNGYYLELE